MKKIFYLSTAFILCGMAQSQASCIQTPSCTSLGYTKTSSCTNGLKCPFGNYWYCPSSSGSSSGSGSGTGAGESSLCSSCNVGDFICGGVCYAPSVVVSERGALASDCTYLVTEKVNGKCTRVTTQYGGNEKLTLQKFLNEANISGNTATFYKYDSVISQVCKAQNNHISPYPFYLPISVVGRHIVSGQFQLEVRIKTQCLGGYNKTFYDIVDCDGTDFKACLNKWNFGEFYIPLVSTF